MAGNGAHCHKLMKETAIAMAHEVYDALMQKNDWYALHKSRHPNLNRAGLERIWVAKHWGQFVEGARATLTQSLLVITDEGLKEQIYEALLLDNTLVAGRHNGQTVTPHN